MQKGNGVLMGDGELEEIDLTSENVFNVTQIGHGGASHFTERCVFMYS